MRVISLVLSLLLITIPASAGEQPVSAPAIDAIPSHGPLLAETNGRDFVVGWTYDGRVSRINAFGELLDPVGIAVPASDIASNGEDYLLVGPCEQLLPIVCLSRLQSGDGSVTALATFDGYSAALAWDGSRFLLVIAPPADGSNLQGLFLDRDGVPQSQPFTISIPVTFPRVASDGQDFLVVGKPHGTGHLRGALVTADADTVPIADFIHLANLPDDDWVTHATDHQVESDGTGFLVSWNTFVDYDAPLRAFVREVTREGALGGPAREIGTGRGALTRESSGYRTLLGTGPAIKTIRLDSDGAPMVSTSVAEGAEQNSVAIVRSGQSSLAVWSDAGTRPFEPVTFFELLDGNGTPRSTPQVFSNGLRSQEQLTGAWGQDAGLLVWVEPRGASRTRRLVVGRVDSAGRSLDGPGKVLWDSGGDQSSPEIEFDGLNYMIVWTEPIDALGRYGLRAARVSADGRMLDAAPIVVDDEWPHASAISWNGVTWVLVWGRSDGTLMAMAIYPSGMTASPPRPVAAPPEPAKPGAASGDIAWDGEKHVVFYVYSHPSPYAYPHPGPPRRDLRTIVLDPFAAPGSSHELIQSSAISGSPRLVWTGNELIAAWSAYSTTSETGLFVATLADGGDRFLVGPRRVLDFELTLSGLTWDGANVVAAATVPYAFRTRWAVLGAKIDPRTLATKAHFVVPDGRAEGVLVPGHETTRLLYARITDRNEATTTQRGFTIEYAPQVRHRPASPQSPGIAGQPDLVMY